MNETTEFKTEDYDAVSIKASSLDAKGVDFFYTGMESGENKFGNTFYVLLGHENEDEDSAEVSIIFNSAKLARLFQDNETLLKNHMVNLSGRGEGVLRQYDVRVLAVQETLD